MNKNLRFGLMALAAVTVGISTGCSSLDGALYNREVKTTPGEITRTNTVYTTNMVVVEASKTNAATGEVSAPVLKQVIVPTITYDYAPPTVVTNLVPRAGIETLIQGGGALPVPFAGTVALGLGWLYSLYASIRNKKIAAGIVQSVQRGREFLQTTPEGQKLDEKFKAILAQHQDSAGIVDEVNKLLTQYVDKRA